MNTNEFSDRPIVYRRSYTISIQLNCSNKVKENMKVHTQIRIPTQFMLSMFIIIFRAYYLILITH